MFFHQILQDHAAIKVALCIDFTETTDFSMEDPVYWFSYQHVCNSSFTPGFFCLNEAVAGEGNGQMSQLPLYGTALMSNSVILSIRNFVLRNLQSASDAKLEKLKEEREAFAFKIQEIAQALNYKAGCGLRGKLSNFFSW